MFQNNWQHNTQVDLVESPKAVIVVVHGYGEHLGRYDQFTERANAAGYAVLRANLLGHGPDSAKVADIAHIDDYCLPVVARVNEARTNCPDLPVVVFGHSLGSLVTLWSASHNAGLADAYVVSGGLVGPDAVPPVKLAITMLLGKVLPNLKISLGFDDDAISSIKAENERYQNDPHVFDKATLRWGRVLMGTLKAVEDQRKWSEPSLWLHGSNDQVNPLAPVQRYIAGQSNWQLNTYQGDHHEVHHDVHAEDFYRDMFNWLAQTV